MTEPMADWIKSEDALPEWGQIVFIAVRHVAGMTRPMWLSYTGGRSENRQTGEECWYADDAEFVPYVETWWQPIIAPDGSRFGMPPMPAIASANMRD